MLIIRLEITSSHDVRIICSSRFPCSTTKSSRNYFLTWCEDNMKKINKFYRMYSLEITSSHDVRIICSNKRCYTRNSCLEITSSHDVRIIMVNIDVEENGKLSRNYFLTWCEDNIGKGINTSTKKKKSSRNYFLTWCEDNVILWRLQNLFLLSRNYFLTWCEDN